MMLGNPCPNHAPHHRAWALDGGARNDAGVPDQPIRLACRLDLRPLQAGKSNSSSNGSISAFGEFYGTSDNASAEAQVDSLCCFAGILKPAVQASTTASGGAGAVRRLFSQRTARPQVASANIGLRRSGYRAFESSL
jgi:hypothetical protein